MENQLKEKELRMGNHIEFDSKIFTVKEIRDKSITVIGRNGYSQLSIIYVNPIPLTEDILVKLGFEIENDNLFDDWSVFTKGNLAIYYDSSKDRFIYLETSIQIKHVHQLQNLYFALCGEELTFKN